MTISEALEIVRARIPNEQPYEIALGCSFTPLHLQTFLAAHCKLRKPALNIAIRPGIFGDLVGTIDGALERQSAQAIAVIIEWQDIDRRFGYREAGNWGQALESDLVPSLPEACGRIESAIVHAASAVSVAVSLPTLPFPPAFHTPPLQSSETELLIRQEIAGLAARLSAKRNIGMISPDWLAAETPMSGRLDVKSDLLIGSPYTLRHADVLASGLARLLFPPQPLKGIITDLDDTFWNGILGEVGPEAVCWDAASSYQLHGLYQRMLCALVDAGVLVAVASKNDPAMVEEAFKRKDLLIPGTKIFPIEAHWAPKSESVARILNAWNISADSVAFVDDAPLELAEVANAHPGIVCLQFPTGDYNGVLALLYRMRDMFGRSRLTDEDKLRLDSIRKSTAFRKESEQAGSDDFLAHVQAAITLDHDVSPANPRILELINKTNQFNLNGIRFTASEWERKLAEPKSFLMAVKYEDKFGPLGTIAVVQGHESEHELQVETWVMSCRAFSRRIEHQCLRAMFERFQVSQVEFRFVPTPRNGPAGDFFAVFLGAVPSDCFVLTRRQFDARCPALYHRVEQVTGVNANG
ncbi:MAG TPA: HAD-IIIC family phosphatase [Bryobacteraceae bacterium]